MRYSPLMCLTRDDPEYSHNQQVKSMVEGGAGFIQLRSKSIPYSDLLLDAKMAADVVKSTNVTLIINDHIKLARDIDADGVHLGKNDPPINEARKYLPSGKVVGKTVHSLQEAEEAKLESPDYVGLGPYRATSTKKDILPVLSDLEFKSIAQFLDPIPVYLIGGLTCDDFELLETLGISGLAICSSLFSGDLVHNIQTALPKFLSSTNPVNS